MKTSLKLNMWSQDGIEHPKLYLMLLNIPPLLMFGVLDVFLLNYWVELLYFLEIVILIKFRELFQYLVPQAIQISAISQMKKLLIL